MVLQKRYLIEDFDKILSLDLIKEDNNIDSELEKIYSR